MTEDKGNNLFVPIDSNSWCQELMMMMMKKVQGGIAPEQPKWFSQDHQPQ